MVSAFARTFERTDQKADERRRRFSAATQQFSIVPKSLGNLKQIHVFVILWLIFLVPKKTIENKLPVTNFLPCYSPNFKTTKKNITWTVFFILGSLQHFVHD